MGIADLSWEVIALFGGIQAVLTGLLGFLGTIWLVRVKARLEASLEKSLYIHKAQFDTEFEIYSILWKELCKVREAIRAISFYATIFNSQVGFSSEAERAENYIKYSAFVDEYNEAIKSFKEVVEINRPFFAADIAEMLFELGDLVDKEKKRDDQDRARQGDGHLHLIDAEGARNHFNIELKSREVCEAIRSRLTGTEIS